MNPVDKLLPLSEALPLLGVRTTKFYSLLNEGQITARRVGRRTLVPESEIRRFQSSLPIIDGHTLKHGPALKRGEAA